MKAGFTTLGKVLAICLSLSLLGGYVWWRNDEARKEEENRLALEKALEEARAKQGDAGISDVEILEEFEIMKGSKSGPVVMPSTKKAPVVLPSTKRAMVMPSSKSGKAVDLEELLEQNPELRKELERRAKEAEEQQGAAENPAKERVLLPSSKSIDSILLPREPKQQQK